MKKVRIIVLVVGMVLSAHLLHAQTFTVGSLNSDATPLQSVTPDSIVQIAAESQGLTQVAPADLPIIGGTYWWVMPGGFAVPAPYMPLDSSVVYQVADGQFLVDDTGGQVVVNTRQFGSQAQATSSTIASALAAQADAVVNLITQIQTRAANQQTRMMARAMGMDIPSPGDGGDSGDGGDYSPMFGSSYTIDTNALWLEITNVSGGLAYLNLHNATNQVYAIWSTTNLLTSWNVETELWPTGSQTNIFPFSVPELNRGILFFRAEDWTGVDSNGDGIPDWWIWMYFHTLDLTATNLDSQGNTLGYDYTNHLDPNVISFLITVTNNYVNTAYPTLPLDISSGVPSYEAILVNDTNMADAVWQSYTGSNVVATLGADGSYNVSVGLRGWPTNATVTWQSVTLVKDTVAPLLTLASPTSGVISNSPAALAGYANEALGGLAFDVSNATGIFTNQQGFLTGQFYDTNLLAFTTNWFQCSAYLSDGTNLITLHGTDWAGNTASVSFTFVYFNTNPPALTVVWPQPDLAISGSSFTVQAQVDSTATKITASIVDSSGDTNTVQGLVEKNGSAWIQNVPLNAGTNFVTITATGANGSMSITNFNVIKNDVGLVIYPLKSYQLNQSSVSVFGEIGDPSLCVWVNGVQATVNDDGTWEADSVPVSPVGTASLSVQVYVGDPVLVASQNYFQPQPVTVGMMSYSGRHELDFYGNGTETINWSYDTGGNYYNDDYGNAEISTNENGVAHIDFGWLSFPFDMPWEYAAVTTPQFYGPWEYSYGNYTQTRVMVEPSGQAMSGTTNLYLVLANAKEFSTYEMEYGPENYIYGWDYFHLLKGIGSYFEVLGLVYSGDTPLPPEWLQIRGQTLINSGITNDDGSVSGMTIVAAPAGVNWDVTPAATQVYQNQAYTFNVQAFDVTPRMLVDNNRDGNVDSLTTPNSPYHFWVNDASESGDISTAANAVPGSSSPNYASSQVNGRSDLVNFFPVALCLSNTMQLLPPTNGWEYHLSQADSAVKFVYTTLTQGNAFDYLTDATNSSGYGVNTNEAAYAADTIQISPSGATGTILDTNWLAMVQNNGGNGVVLMEGCKTSTAPLMLELWHKDQNGVDQKMGGVPLYLSIGGVEQMYRWVNLRHVVGQSETRATDVSQPANNPDSLSDGKQFVFVHGYNVNEQSARGWSAEMFKRLYQARSKAKFYAVDWNGSQSQGDYVSGETANYQTNAVNAFLTAPYLATFINGLSGSTILAGHSLGNMVCLSAISDSGAVPSQYFMIDAAVPMEAIDGTVPINNDMVTTSVGGGNWLAYNNRLWASEWYNLWPNTDARSTLTWSNRLANLGSVDIYNFYSSGEDVLRDYPGNPPSSLFTLFGGELVGWIFDEDLGMYAWAWQEKDKGLMSGNSILSSNHGGWRFNAAALNPNSYTAYTVDMANGIPASQLQTNAFFDFGWHTFGSNYPDYDYLQVPDSSGSSYAAANRNRILSDAIPALTLPIGANDVTNLDVRVSDQRNFDMQANYENSWPIITGDEKFNWHHSDICNVAYPYTYKAFNAIVSDGNLK